MLKKILLLLSLLSVVAASSAAAADKIYDVPEMNCTVSWPENYTVAPVERPTDQNDELGVKVAQLAVSDPADPTLAIHIMVESSKLTQELPDLDYKPGAVMKDYFTEMLQNSGWQEPVVLDTLANGEMYFIKFGSYITDSAGHKYDGEIYATVNGGKLLYLMLMSKERALKPEEKTLLQNAVGQLHFKAAV